MLWPLYMFENWRRVWNDASNVAQLALGCCLLHLCSFVLGSPLNFCWSGVLMRLIGILLQRLRALGHHMNGASPGHAIADAVPLVHVVRNGAGDYMLSLSLDSSW